MQRDIMEGRPSELETQTGAAVRLWHAAGVCMSCFTVNLILNRKEILNAGI
jgi:hypothetical protein